MILLRCLVEANVNYSRGESLGLLAAAVTRASAAMAALEAGAIALLSLAAGGTARASTTVYFLP